MGNVKSNPWSFTHTDLVAATLVASPGGLTQNADGTVTMTATAPLPASFVAGAFLTLIGQTNAGYVGFYEILATATPAATLLPQFTMGVLTASGGGTANLNQYVSMVRIEDISWQQGVASDQIDLRDRNGQPLWLATCPAGSGTGTQNRGKLFWVNGFTITRLDSGIVIVTIN